jgi:MFS family permease
MVPGIDWKYPGWTKKYELVCENESLRENYLLMTELLPAFIGLFASVQSDTAGRVWTFKFWTIGIMVLSFAAAWIEVAWVQVVALSLFIGEEAILCTLFTYIINESCATTSPLRSKAIGFYFAIFASGGVLLSCLSWVVQDPQWLYFIVVCLSIAVSIPVQWTCYEPPKQLHKRGKVVGLLKNLEAIALRNDKGIEMPDIQQKTGIIDVPLDGKMQISTLLTFKEKIQLICTNLRVVFCTNICVRMIGLGLVAGSVYCCFFGVTYNAGKIGLPSLQLNVILLASIEAICYVASIFVIAKTRRKCGTIICLLIILFGSCALITVHALWGEYDWNKYIETGITVVLIKGGLSMEYVIIYTYASELFPSTVRGTAVGFALTLAKVLAAFTSGPLIAFAETMTASMVGPSITVVVGLLAILVLPETLNQKLE